MSFVESDGWTEHPCVQIWKGALSLEYLHKAAFVTIHFCNVSRKEMEIFWFTISLFKCIFGPNGSWFVFKQNCIADLLSFWRQQLPCKRWRNFSQFETTPWPQTDWDSPSTFSRDHMDLALLLLELAVHDNSLLDFLDRVVAARNLQLSFIWVDLDGRWPEKLR